METNEREKPKGVSWTAFIGGTVSLAIAIFSAWNGLTNRDAAQETRIMSLEIQQNRMETKLDKISDKLDAINVTLANKQDRAN